MFLDERKRKILQAVIKDYIDTAEPIGSRTVARKHGIGLSSATIRNEMADLEEMGFLQQPHTSAGRIPSDKGYRIYVDHLMPSITLSMEDADAIKKAMDVKINELNQLIRHASAVMASITNYTSMAVTPQMKKSILKAVQVVPVEKGKALVIVVNDAGIVRNSLIKISEYVTPDYLIKISNILNEKLNGLSIEQINLSVISEIEKLLDSHKDILLPLLNEVAECINLIDNPELYLEGVTNILNHPEFSDLIKAKNFLNIMDSKQTLFDILKGDEQCNRITVHIGTENNFEVVKDCSIVTATYKINNTVIGKIGIIGPTRMEYGKVISSLDFIRESINNKIVFLLGEGLDSE